VGSPRPNRLYPRIVSQSVSLGPVPVMQAPRKEFALSLFHFAFAAASQQVDGGSLLIIFGFIAFLLLLVNSGRKGRGRRHSRRRRQEMWTRLGEQYRSGGRGAGRLSRAEEEELRDMFPQWDDDFYR